MFRQIRIQSPFKAEDLPGPYSNPHISFHSPSLFYFLHSKYNLLMLPYIVICLLVVCILHQNVKTTNTGTFSIMLTTVSNI